MEGKKNAPNNFRHLFSPDIYIKLLYQSFTIWALRERVSYERNDFEKKTPIKYCIEKCLLKNHFDINNFSL